MEHDGSLTAFLKSVIPYTRLPSIKAGWTKPVEDDPTALAHTLLSARGQVSGVVIADRILNLVEASDESDFLRFAGDLRDLFEVDLDAVASVLEDESCPLERRLANLQKVAEPPRQELFRRLNAAPNGTVRMVKLRKRLLMALRDDRSLAPVDADLKHLFRSWFNRGFLRPRRIDWGTSAAILEKIIAYEAVHAIDTWDALRARLVPEDRLCYAFFHPAMPDEPLIFVEVALTNGIANSVDRILESPRDTLAANEADTAIFYSISNCQAGLAGVSFGALLIKQVVTELRAALPNLTTFATLSPIPGLTTWLGTQGLSATPQHSERLRALAAQYLAQAQDETGRPLDPVARFHLGNGAQLYRINPGADGSARGQAQSLGAMVNYLYELDRIEPRHEAFALEGTISCSREIRKLLDSAPARRAENIRS